MSAFFYDINGYLSMDKEKILVKWVFVAKWYWCQINEHESCIANVLFFKKQLLRGK